MTFSKQSSYCGLAEMVTYNHFYSLPVLFVVFFHKTVKFLLKQEYLYLELKDFILGKSRVLQELGLYLLDLYTVFSNYLLDLHTVFSNYTDLHSCN